MRDEYMRYLQHIRALSDHTVEGYRHDLNSFAAFLVESGIEENDLTPKQARAYVASLTRDALAPATVNRALSALKGYYRFLIRRGEAEYDPFASVSSLKKSG